MKTVNIIALTLGAAALAAACQPQVSNSVSTPAGSSNQVVKSVEADLHVATVKSPHGIAFAQGRAYVCNVGSNLLTVIDAATGATESAIVVQQSPSYVAASHDGKKLFVTNGGAGSISIVDLADGNAVTHVPVGPSPDKVHSTHDDKVLYVACAKDNKSVVKVDLTADPIATTSIPVGKAGAHRSLVVLHDMAIAPDSDEKAVALIDGATDAVTSVEVGTKPGAIAVGTFGDRHILVVGNGGAGTASLIDLATKAVVKTLDVGLSPSDAVAVGARVYMTNSGSNTVSVIDVQEQKVIATLSVGKKPVHAFVAPAGGSGPAKQVWIGNDGSSFASVIDADANTVYASVETQVGHHKMAFSADGKKAFITNITSNSTSVIDRTKL